MKQQRTESVTESVPGDEVGAAAGPEGASPWKLPFGTTTAVKKAGMRLPPLDTLTL